MTIKYRVGLKLWIRWHFQAVDDGEQIALQVEENRVRHAGIVEQHRIPSSKLEPLGQ